MEIIKSFPETLSNKQKYSLTMSPKIQKMTEAKGSTLELACWAIYRDTDSEGEEREILSIITPDGEAFATNSATFRADFERMIDLLGADEVTAIEVISGTSKNNREFITCAYAGD